MTKHERISLLGKEDEGDGSTAGDVSQKELPFERSGIIGKFTLMWMRELIKKIFDGTFSPDTDLWSCTEESTTEKLSASLEKVWYEEVKQVGEKRASLARALWRHERRRAVVILALAQVSALLQFLASSFGVRYLLQFTNGNQEWRFGVLVGVVFIGSLCISTLLEGLSKSLTLIYAVRQVSAIRGLLFRKLMRLKYATDTDTGKIVNILINSSERFMYFQFAFDVIGTPFLVLVFVGYSALTLQPVALIGTVTIPLGIGVLFLIGHLNTLYKGRCTTASDKRIQLLHGILSNMKTVKMFAWEKYIIGTVNESRDAELKPIKRANFVVIMFRHMGNAMEITLFVGCVAPILLSTGHIMSAEVFNIFAVVGLLSFSLRGLPLAMSAIAENIVALRRLKSVLIMAEYKSPIQPDEQEKQINNGNNETGVSDDTDGDVVYDLSTSAINTHAEMTSKDGAVIEFKMATFARNADSTSSASAYQPDDDSISVLENLDFSILKRSLVGVCGSVGCGKSSLFSAIIGRMALVSGEYRVRGRMAIVPQESWIHNDTLKNNIVCGGTYSHRRYKRVLKDCCLVDDILTLPAGDQTEIGERGTTLSGGQKQRVSLARALYDDADVYLLDDPLSAVDSRVGAEMFNKCILTNLHGKTVLLVTHNPEYLRKCDQVLFLHKKIVLSTHKDLIGTNDLYKQLILCNRETEVLNTFPLQSNGLQRRLTQEQEPTTLGKPDGGRLVEDEDHRCGSVLPAVLTYIRGAGGAIAFACVAFLITLSSCAKFCPIWWLNYAFHTEPAAMNCTSPCERISLEENSYFEFVMFACFPLFGVIAFCAEGLAVSLASNKASRAIHQSLLYRTMTGCVVFFQATPIGRLQNCFSTMMTNVDRVAPVAMQLLWDLLIQGIIILSAVAINDPYMGLYIVVCAWPVLHIMKRLIVCVSGLQRLETIQQSVLFSSITSTIQGLPTIVLSGKQDIWQRKLFRLQDRFAVIRTCRGLTSRWAAARTTAVASLLTSLIAVLIIALPVTQTTSKTGFTLTFSLQLGRFFSRVMLASNFVVEVLMALERMEYFSQKIVAEPQTPASHKDVGDEWPSHGRVTFRDVCVRYRQHLPLALRHVTFTISPGEKIGVVGRTGAGKSSLVAALLRLVNLDSGSILIDGVDVSTVALDRLRSSIAVIPQDPFLFAGTLRSNIDPFDELSDDEIWKVLQQCYLRDLVMSLPGGLTHHIVGGGATLSVGERQLLCMARAIGRKAKIVVLDEATSSLDPHTDRLLQETVSRAFAGCTMLVIAHRLHTILSCDRILLLHQGQIQENDTISNLLAYDSMFKRLLDASENSGGRCTSVLQTPGSSLV